MVEALRTAFDDQFPDLKPKSIDIEYPEDEEQWPSILVQFHPSGQVSWTGINPDEFEILDEPTDPNDPWEVIKFRRGYFEGSYDLTILSQTSQERDRLWDLMVELVLFGRERVPTSRFWSTIDNHDLIAMTLQEPMINPMGDSIGLGTPWSPEDVAYEATLRINCVGEFVSNPYNQTLVRITKVQFFPYTDEDPVPGEGDGLGPWVSPGSSL
jgi:hypothetical protein